MTTHEEWNVSLDWTEEEQRALESCMARFPPDHFDPVQRCVKTATLLPRKSVRDVALRMKWTTVNQHELRKRRLDESSIAHHTSMGGGGFRNPSLGGGGGGLPLPSGGMHHHHHHHRPLTMPMVPPPPPSSTGGNPYLHPHHAPPPPPVPSSAPGGGMLHIMMPPPPPHEQSLDDPSIIQAALNHPGGSIIGVLELNYRILNQFRENMANFKVGANTQLLIHFRDNLYRVINLMESTTGSMSKMPPLPVRMNTELASTFLPPPRPTTAIISSLDRDIVPPQPAIDAPGMVPLTNLVASLGNYNSSNGGMIPTGDLHNINNYHHHQR